MYRRFNHNTTKQIPTLPPRTGLIPFPRSLKSLPVCVSDGIFSFTRPSSVGTSSSPPSAASPKTYGDFAKKISAFPLKNFMRLNVHLDIEIAGRATMLTRLTLAGKTYAIAGIDTCRNFDR